MDPAPRTRLQGTQIQAKGDARAAQPQPSALNDRQGAIVLRPDRPVANGTQEEGRSR